MQTGTAIAPILHRMVLVAASKFHVELHSNYDATATADRILHFHGSIVCRHHNIVTIFTTVTKLS